MDPFARRFLDLMAATKSSDKATRTIEDYRRGYESLTRFSAKADVGLCDAANLRIEREEGPLDIRMYNPAPDAETPMPLMIWLHGGGWVAGSSDSSDAICRIIAAKAGFRVASVDYRLAPESPFPLGLNDCIDAIVNLWAQADELGFSRDGFCLGAESAGVHLAAASVSRVLDLGVRFKMAFFICPVIDPCGSWPSRQEYGEGHLLEEGMLADYLALYARDADPMDDRISPMRSSRLGEFPMTLIHTAEFDPVRDEGEAFAAALKSAGVEVRHRRHSGMIHNFHMLTGAIPAANQHVTETIEDLRRSFMGA